VIPNRLNYALYVVILFGLVSCTQQLDYIRNDCYDVKVKSVEGGATTTVYVLVEVQSRCGPSKFSGTLLEFSRGYSRADVSFLDTNILLVSTGYGVDEKSSSRTPSEYAITNLNYAKLSKITIESGSVTSPFYEELPAYLVDSIPAYEIAVSKTSVDFAASIMRFKNWPMRTRSLLIRPVDSLWIERVAELPLRVAVKWKGSSEEQVLLITPPEDEKPMEISIE
jgi:hypothetical protein